VQPSALCGERFVVRLSQNIATSLPSKRLTIIDGEIVCPDSVAHIPGCRPKPPDGDLGGLPRGTDSTVNYLTQNESYPVKL
jgi:hypothetical protein